MTTQDMFLLPQNESFFKAPINLYQIISWKTLFFSKQKYTYACKTYTVCHLIDGDKVVDKRRRVSPTGTGNY